MGQNRPEFSDPRIRRQIDSLASTDKACRLHPGGFKTSASGVPMEFASVALRSRGGLWSAKRARLYARRDIRLVSLASGQRDCLHPRQDLRPTRCPQAPGPRTPSSSPSQTRLKTYLTIPRRRTGLVSTQDASYVLLMTIEPGELACVRRNTCPPTRHSRLITFRASKLGYRDCHRTSGVL